MKYQVIGWEQTELGHLAISFSQIYNTIGEAIDIEMGLLHSMKYDDVEIRDIPPSKICA